MEKETLICFLLIIAAGECIEISPSQSVYTVAEGSHIQVNCSSKYSISWTKGTSPPRTRPVATVNSSGDNVSTLTLRYLEQSDSGTYRCTDQEGERVVELQVLSVRPQEAEFEPFKDAELRCGLQDTSKNYTYIWTKGYLPVADIPVQGNQAYIAHGNGLLEIKHPVRSFAGLYVCGAQFEDNGKQRSIDIYVKYYATPQVLPFESKDVVLGETLTIECRVLGYPKPGVSWYKDGEPVVGRDEARYKLQTANTYNGEQMENARLQRDSVDLDDGGKYLCVAKSDKWPAFNSTQEILVRVNEATVGTSTDSSTTRTSPEDEGDSDNNSTTTTDTESSSSNALAIGLGVAGGVCVLMAAVGAGVYFKERRPGQLYASPDNAPPASVPPDNGPQAAGSAVPPQN